MIERYEISGKEWVPPGGMPVDRIQEVHSALAYVFEVLCEHISIDERPDVDEEFRKLYLGIKFIHPKLE